MAQIDTFFESVLAMPRYAKRVFAVLIDALLAVATVWLAFYLRIGEFVSLSHDPLPAAIAAVLLAVPVFIASGLYGTVFRYIGWDGAISIVRGAAIYGLLYATIFTLFGWTGIPRTVGIIQPILLFLAVSASRAVARYLLGGGYRHRIGRKNRKKVAIYGAGMSGRQLASALADERHMQVVAFLDDNRQLQGSLVSGVRVWPPKNLRELIGPLGISDVLLAIPSASRRRRNEILEGIRPLGIAVRTLPSMQEMADGKIEFSDIRPLAIEDVLGREAVTPDEDLLDQGLRGRVILVTGAGGSIGTELCRQIIRFRPETLLLVENSEFALYTVNEELQALARADGAPPVRVVPLLASVCDEARMRTIFAGWQPHAVYHAAAYKHVPLVEHNVVEGLRNNVLGTWIVASLACEFETARFVLISTDKAVRPTNIMGATKRFAEIAGQATAATQAPTCFSMVRFGNVLGSSGSVLPLFRKQIKLGGPVTVTHREATRYFMTIPEAAQLVLQAGGMAKGGEVFVLDMGQPVKVLDLAMRMIELSGYKPRTEATPAGDIEIEFMGLRPGEKLYEELLIGNDPTATDHPRIMMAQEKFLPLAELRAAIAHAEQAVEQQDVEFARRILTEVVPEYAPAPEMVDWVGRQQGHGEGLAPAETGREQASVVRLDQRRR